MEGKKSASLAAQEAAVRILGDKNAEYFRFTEKETPGKNAFRVYGKDGKVQIEACDGVSFLSGLNWYLRYICKKQITWETNLPLAPLGELSIDFEEVIMHSPYQYRYFLNYCTYSYTMAFWDWERWEKELDLMALGGVNLALSLTGQETVIRETLLQLGMEEKDVDEYLPGPVYYAWFFMGNLSAFGERLPKQWYEDRVTLAGKIHGRMGELGISPVLPGFYGMIPQALRNSFPTAQTVEQGKWCGFQRPDCLTHEDPLFDRMAQLYYENQKKKMGDITPYFAADPFHEGGKRENIDLPGYGAAVMEKMKAYRRDAVWVIQAWDQNPSLSLFERIDPKSVLILNLLSGRVQDSHKITGEFGALPWIYCPVHSYGGRNSMYGFLRTMAREPLEIRRQKGSLCGIGLAPESLETNPVFYDLFWDMTYREQTLEPAKWLEEYVYRRYGKATKEAVCAWKLLEDSVYNSFVPQPGGAESYLCARPGLHLTSVSTWGPKQVNYDMDYVKRAGRLLFSQMDALWESEGFRYDLVDVTRQCLANESRIVYARLQYCLGQGQKEGFLAAKQKFLELLRTQEEVLAGHEAFGLKRFLEVAAKCGQKYGMEKAFIRQAKTLLTVWGDERCEVLHDYSCREWSGLTGSFYYERWKLFLDILEENLQGINKTYGTGSLTKDWEGEGEEGESEMRLPDDSFWYRLEKQWAETTDTGERDWPVKTEAFVRAYREFIGGSRDDL